MSDKDDVDLSILKQPLPSTNEFKGHQYRLMGFATGLALLVALAPTWFVRDRDTNRIFDLYSGTSLFGFAPDKDAPLGALGVVLVLVYVALALSLLVAPAESAYGLVAGIAGLVVTLVIVLAGKALADYGDMSWTGAPFIALGIWAVAVLVSIAARSADRS
jgi:hypothetical protein